MSIKRRIWALPVISAVIFGLGVAVSAWLATGALDSIHTTEQVDYPVLSASKALASEVGDITDGLRDAVSEGDKTRIDQLDGQAAKVRERLAKLGTLAGMGATGKNLSAMFDAYYAPAVSAARIMLEVEKGDAQATVARMQSAQGVLNKELDRFAASAQTQFTDGIERSASSVRRVLVVTIATALAVIAVLALVSWFVVRTIWRQLGGEPEYARGITRAVAAGDLSMAIRTEAQAGSLEHTTRAVEALTDTVRANAENTNQANALVVAASGIATRGGEVVGSVVTTMGDINASARRIVEIIAVIDGIAFQTNILALNAAVEAARAGEQGRGFAVVASEVRNLAQRSAAAAKEIKELIGDSVAKVDAGSVLVGQAGVTMEQIVASVRKVHDIMAEISEAGQRQRVGIEQIGEAIDAMDHMTQQNAALVEEASAAAESLTGQTAQLTEALAVFKLAEMGHPTPAPEPHLALNYAHMR